MAAPMFLRIKRSILMNIHTGLCSISEFTTAVVCICCVEDVHVFFKVYTETGQKPPGEKLP
jgi:hypothetical protein